ncbi:MAG: DNA primase [Planctomycetota bacterium]
MPGMFSEESIQRVRDANDIVNIAETYITVKRAGSTFKALCPFHNEKTPSFSLNPELQLFKCFGCGEGGDIFKFVMKMDGLSFPEAVELLADRSGIQLERSGNYDPERSKAASEEKKKLIWTTKRAAVFFERQLHESRGGREGLEYLLERGFSLDTIKSWRLGWAPDSFEELQRFLISESGGKEEKVLSLAVRSGLLRESDRGGDPYDFFRGRVMFPIRDLHGQPIAFGGRILKQDPDRPVGKYVNSPETPLFNKSQVLFGLDAASREMRISRTALIVEGYTDVIMCHQHGIRNAVATLGTALTKDHIRLLRRQCDTVVAMFDSDDAGAKATQRAIQLFMEEGMPLKVVRSLELKDACDFIPEMGKEPFLEAINDAQDSFTHALHESFERRNLNSVDEKTEAIREVMQVVNLCSDPVKRELMRGTVASYAGVPADTLPAPAPRRDRLGGGKPLRRAAREERLPSPSLHHGDPEENGEEAGGAPIQSSHPVDRERETLEIALLRYMIDSRDWCDRACRAHSPEQFCTAALVDLATEIHDGWNDRETLDISGLLQRLQNPEATSILSDLTMREKCILTEKHLDETLQRIRKLKLEGDRNRVRQELIQAQAIGDQEKIDALSREDYLIARDIQELGRRPDGIQP